VHLRRHPPQAIRDEIADGDFERAAVAWVRAMQASTIT
jgi:hypothetical protein